MRPKGFTLIELLLTLGLTGLVVVVVSGLLQLFLVGRIKSQTIAEVEQQGQAIMLQIAQTARNAESLTAPIPAARDVSLTLDVTAPSQDPTVFSLASGVLQMTEGAAPAVALSNNRVTVSNLLFTNVSRPNTPGAVRIEFTVAHNNSSGRQEFGYTKNFAATASIRSP